jgi:DNA-binding MarR family transcriptional regulator
MPPKKDREALFDELVQFFPQRAGRFSRVLTRAAHSGFPRGMAQILASVEDGPRAVTQLAEQEGLAQPTVTNMVVRLERLGLVTRERAPHDGRVVLVEMTDAGRKELSDQRARHSLALRRQIEALPDRELRELVRASDALQRLIERLQNTERD